MWGQPRQCKRGDGLRYITGNAIRTLEDTAADLAAPANAPAFAATSAPIARSQATVHADALV